MILQSACNSIHTLNWAHSLLYLGPGMGGGLLSLIIAFIVSFFTFLIAIIWYPIKKAIDFFRRLGNNTSKTPGQEEIPDNNSAEKEKI
jgi:hypothetical protein